MREAPRLSALYISRLLSAHPERHAKYHERVGGIEHAVAVDVGIGENGYMVDQAHRIPQHEQGVRRVDRAAYTWWSYMFKAREKDVGWRIDYFLVSKRFAEKVKDALIYKDVMGSDHCPVGLLLND